MADSKKKPKELYLQCGITARQACMKQRSRQLNLSISQQMDEESNSVQYNDQPYSAPRSVVNHGTNYF